MDNKTKINSFVFFGFLFLLFPQFIWLFVSLFRYRFLFYMKTVQIFKSSVYHCVNLSEENYDKWLPSLHLYICYLSSEWSIKIWFQVKVKTWALQTQTFWKSYMLKAVLKSYWLNPNSFESLLGQVKNFFCIFLHTKVSTFN